MDAVKSCRGTCMLKGNFTVSSHEKEREWKGENQI